VDRIAIIGCGGSGKSLLSRSLGILLGITPVHLDGLYYDQDWKPLDKEQFVVLQRELVSAPGWIIDGNYASSLPIRLQAADTVIFLDLPGWTCLWGIAQRRLRHRGGQHKDIGVYDRITWHFVRYILGYRRQMAPRVRKLMADHAGNAEVAVLRSRRAARDYLAAVSVQAPPARAVPADGERKLTRSPTPASFAATRMLAKRMPNARVIGADLSAAPLVAARQRLTGASHKRLDNQDRTSREIMGCLPPDPLSPADDAPVHRPNCR